MRHDNFKNVVLQYPETGSAQERGFKITYQRVPTTLLCH